MYKIINVIENIKNVFTSSDNHIIIDKNERFYYNGNEIKDYKSVYFVLDTYVLKNKEKLSYLFLNDELIKELYHSYIFNTYSDEGCLYYENLHYDSTDNEIKKDIYYHDFLGNTKKLIAKKVNENFIFRRNEKVIIFKPKTTLRSLSLLTGEYEWEFDVSGFPSYHFIDEEKTEEIKGLIGIWNDLLLVILASGKLLALDIHTGKQEWLLTSDIYKSGGAIPIIDHAVLSAEEGKLYALHREYFIEIDLEQLSITRYRPYGTEAYPKHPFDEVIGIPERLKNLPDTSLHSITVSSATYFQGRFYFTAYTQKGGGRDQNIPIDGGYVGVFNIQTEEVEWWYDLGFLGHKERYLHQPPQVTEDKLYVLDSIGTLHIFEKDK